VRQLLHISDIHFGPHHLPEVMAGVHHLIALRQPDLVVISGDLTQRAKVEQFREARAFVDHVPVPTLTVPGNHDVPMYRVWERLLAPYGAYRKHFAEEMEPIFEDDEMVVIGVNTAWNFTVKDGRITPASLRRLARRLRDAPAGKARVVVAHQQVVPPPRFDTQRVLLGAAEMVQVLRDGGVDLVLSGHLHQTWIGDTEAYYPTGDTPVLLVHAGTTTSGRGRGKEKGRNTCNWIRLSEKTIEICHLSWSPTTARFLEESRHLYPRHQQSPYALEEHQVPSSLQERTTNS